MRCAASVRAGRRRSPASLGLNSLTRSGATASLRSSRRPRKPFTTPKRQAVGEVRVVKASPLITLAKVGRLDLLTRGGQQLVVPTQVADEVLAGPERDPARLAPEGGFDRASDSI